MKTNIDRNTAHARTSFAGIILLKLMAQAVRVPNRAYNYGLPRAYAHFFNRHFWLKQA